ncbi:MAG: hypothetical protein ACP5N7_01060 [Candidatus Pacearchaeota archaeon]
MAEEVQGFIFIPLKNIPKKREEVITFEIFIPREKKNNYVIATVETVFANDINFQGKNYGFFSGAEISVQLRNKNKFAKEKYLCNLLKRIVIEASNKKEAIL